MKVINFLFLAFVILSYFACKLDSPAEQSEVETADYLIEDVALLPMTDVQLIPHQYVYLKDGKILKTGKDNSLKAKKVIDGKGKFLMPGFTEMHAHIPVAKDGNDTLVRQTLFLYLSQGITNIRGMLGDPYHLLLKEAVANEEILGPRIYTSSPSLNGNNLTSPELAKEKVTQYQKDGYDFLKIHPGIKLEVWEEIEKTAKEVGIPYAGHVPVEVGIHRALESKYQTVDHLDGYIEGLVPASVGVNPNANGFFGYNFANLADVERIEQLVAKTLENGVGIVTTQTLFTRWFSPEPAEKLAAEPEMKYMPPKTLYAWRQNKSRMISAENYNEEQWKSFLDLRVRILKEMDQKGVLLLLGSDAPQVFNVPGFSIHHELLAMSDAGISNINLLRSGTSSPAVFFNAKGQYGTIEKGAAADLLLLNSNPLENLASTSDIAGVMVGTNWLSRAEIDLRLAEIANAYAEMSTAEE